MNCDPLPLTGLGPYVGLILIAGLICVVIGVVLLTARSRTKTLALTMPMLLVIGAIGALWPTAPAQAATAACVTEGRTLMVTQTSTLEGLAPGVAPVSITGLVVNDTGESTYVEAVRVAITSVTTAPATKGVCGATDYILLSPMMSVGQTLDPAASISFSGASIAFASARHNQDACQRATIHLSYTANP